MTDWIDFAVYAAFLVTIWIIYPWADHRLLVPRLEDRNPRWVAENPEAVHRIERHGRWRLWLSYLLGCASLGLLLYLKLEGHAPGGMTTVYGTPLTMWMLLWTLSINSMLVGMVLMGGIGIIGWIRLTRMIPVASRRYATLETRSLDDVIPRGVRYAVYALVLVNLLVWTYFGLTGQYTTPRFWARYGILIGLTAAFAAFTRYAVNRRPNAMDRILGPGNRRAEVRFNFACHLLVPIIGAVRLYEEVTGTELVNINRAMFLALALIIIFGLLRTIHLTPAPRRPAPLPRDTHDYSQA